MALVRIGIQAHSTGFDKAAQDVNRAVTAAENDLTRHAEQALGELRRTANGALITLKGVTAEISQEGKIDDIPRAFEEATKQFKDFALASREGVGQLKIMRQTIRGITFEFDAMEESAESVNRTMNAAGNRAVDQARDQLDLEERIINARRRSANELSRAQAIISQPGGVLASDLGQQRALNDPAIQGARKAEAKAGVRARDAQELLAQGLYDVRRGGHVANVDKEIRARERLNREREKAVELARRLRLEEERGGRTKGTRAKIKALNKQNREFTEARDRVVALRDAVTTLDRELEKSDPEVDALTRSMEFLTAESGKAAKKLASLKIALDRLNVRGGGKKVDRQALLEKIEEQQALLRSIEKVRRKGTSGSMQGQGARPFGDLESKSLRELVTEIDKLEKGQDKAAQSAAELRQELQELRTEEIEKADEAVEKLDTRYEELGHTIRTKDVAALNKLQLALERSTKEFDELSAKAAKAEDKLRVSLEQGIEEPARQAEKELADLERQLGRVATQGQRTAREMRQLALDTIRAGGDVSNIDDARFLKDGKSGGRGSGSRAARGVVELTDVVKSEGLFSEFDRIGSKLLIRIGLIYSAIGAGTAVFRAFGAAINAVVREERFSDTMNTFISLSSEASTGLNSLGQVFNVLGGTVARFDVTSAAAKARMSGLAEETIPQVAQAARILSRAVGVDTTEAFDRLSRGIAKQEVEILDELGIIVRLNDALRKWATENNRTVESLTAQERQVAFANEVLGVLAARYSQIGTQTSRLTDNAAQLAARWADLGITTASSLKGFSDLGIAIGNAGAALVDAALPAIGETRIRIALLDAQTQTFNEVLAGALGKEGTVKDVVAALDDFQTKLADLTEGSLEYEQTLEDQEEFLGKLKIAFPALNREIAAYTGSVEGASEKLGNLLEKQKEFLGLVSKGSLNEQGQALAGMRLLADSVASSLVRAREELQKLNDADSKDFRGIREAQDVVNRLEEREQSLRSQSKSKSISFTGAGFTPEQAQPFEEIVQVLSQLRAGVGLGGAGKVGSQTRLDIGSRLDNLTVSMEKAVAQGVFSPEVAANVRSRGLAIRTGDRGSVSRDLTQNVADILAEIVRNTPEGGKDTSRLLVESAMAAGAEASGERSFEMFHKIRELLRATGLTQEATTKALARSFLTAPVNRVPLTPSRPSDAKTPAQEIESAIGVLVGDQSRNKAARKLRETAEAARLKGLEIETEERKRTGATIKLRSEEAAKKAIEIADRNLKSAETLQEAHTRQLEAAELSLAKIKELIGGGSIDDPKVAETLLKLETDIAQERSELDTAVLATKAARATAGSGLSDRQFSMLMDKVVGETTIQTAYHTERRSDNARGRTEAERTSGDPLGAVLGTIRTQREHRSVAEQDLVELKRVVRKLLADEGATTGIDAAVDAAAAPLAAVISSIRDDIANTTSRIPSVVRAQTDASGRVRAQMDAATARLADREGDFDRNFPLTGIGSETSIGQLASSRRRIEGMGTALEQATGPANLLRDRGQATRNGLLQAHWDLFRSPLSGTEGPVGDAISSGRDSLLDEAKTELKSMVALEAAIDSLQTTADAARKTGLDLLHKSAQRLAGTLSTKLSDAAAKAELTLANLQGTPEKMSRLRAIMGGAPADVTATLDGREFSFGAPSDVGRTRSSLKASEQALTDRRTRAVADTATLKEQGADPESIKALEEQTTALSYAIMERQKMLVDLDAAEKDILERIAQADFDKLGMDIAKVVESGNIGSITTQMEALNNVLEDMSDLTGGEQSAIRELIEDLEEAKTAALKVRQLTDEVKNINAVGSARRGAIGAVGRTVSGAVGGGAASIIGGLTGLIGGASKFGDIAATQTSKHAGNLAEREAGVINEDTFLSNKSAIDSVATMGKIAAGAGLVGQGISIATTAWSMFNARAEEAKQKVREIQEAARAMGEEIAGAISTGFEEGTESLEDFVRNHALSTFRADLSRNVLQASGFQGVLNDIATAQQRGEDARGRRPTAANARRFQGFHQTFTQAEREDIIGQLGALRGDRRSRAKRGMQTELTLASGRTANLGGHALMRLIVFLDGIAEDEQALGGALKRVPEVLPDLTDALEGGTDLFNKVAEQLGIQVEQGSTGVSEIATATFRAVTEPQANLLLSATMEMRDLQVQIASNTRRTADVLATDIMGALLANGHNAGAARAEDGAAAPQAAPGMKLEGEMVMGGNGAL